MGSGTILFGNAPRGTFLPDNIQKTKIPRRNGGSIKSILCKPEHVIKEGGVV